MTSTPAALTVSDLAVDLGGRRVLEHTDLTISRGELVGLIGPNGAGKTTLLRTILGLLRPAAGTIHAADRTSRPARGRIGYVPQRHEFAWDYPISVAGAVMTGLTGRLGPLRRPNLTHWEAVADALDGPEIGSCRVLSLVGPEARALVVGTKPTHRTGRLLGGALGVEGN